VEEKLSGRSLAARINDLKKLGWDFKPYRREDKNYVYVVTKTPEQTLFS
jgi:hypothetical protein